MFYHSNCFQRNPYIDSNGVPFSNIHILKTPNINTVFIHCLDLHLFFLDFLKEHVYPYPDMWEISSFNLLTNIQTVLKLYVIKHSLRHYDKIILDENLSRVIDGALEVAHLSSA